MITFSKIKSSAIVNGKRIFKILQYGAKTAISTSVFGDDSFPPPGVTAIYADTAENGESIIIGYLISGNNQLSDVGEKRLYSLDENGDLSFSIWLKNDGTFEIGGNADNAVRYQKLDDALQAQKTAINAELAKIAAAINAIVPGSYVPTLITIDTSAAKIDEVKTL